MRKKRLGDRLVEAGIIDKLQLRAALGQQAQWGKTLGRTLLEMRLVTEDELIPILSEQLNMPPARLRGRKLNLEAVAFLEEDFCRSFECIPFEFHEKNRFLDVAMSDAQNTALYDQIRVRTRCNIRPFIAGPEEIRNAIDRAYGEDLQAMKLSFMLTENVFDFGEAGAEDELETAIATGPRRSMGVDPAMAAEATASATTPRDTPRDSPSLPAPSAVAVDATPDSEEGYEEEQGYDDQQEQGYDDQGYEQEQGYDDQGYDASPPANPAANEESIVLLEGRLAQVEERLRRQDLFIRGLVSQLRELFGQLAAQRLLQTNGSHPLVPRAKRTSRPENPVARPRPVSRSMPAQPPAARARRVTRPDIPLDDPPLEARARRNRPDATIEQEPVRPRSSTDPELAPARPRRVSAPQGVPVTSAPPQRPPRMTEPVEPVSVDIDVDVDDGDDDVEFMPGTGRLVESPRPKADAVRPSAPRKTSGAEPTLPLVDVPAGSDSVIAIDLGTTRSSVAAVVDGQVSVLKLPGGEWDMPSVVGFREDGSVMLGKSARMMLANDPENAISSPKRLLGHRIDERALQPYLAQLGVRYFHGARDEVTLEPRGRPVTITEVCAHILNLLRLVAERNLGRKVEEVILTTPVTFNDRQFTALGAAAQLAGLTVLEFVPEPVAATLSCISDPHCQGPVAVYDFGGGTFDFSVVNVGSETMEVIATSGDGWLGGDDFDEALAGAAANSFWQQTQIELRNQVHHWQRLLVRAEIAKRALTDQPETTVRLPGAATTAQGEVDLVYPCTRDKFASLCRGIIRRSLETCQAALDRAKLKVSDLNAVYLSGGTTYTPAVRQAVTEFFQKEPRTVVPPERAVLVGAAVHGALVHREAAASSA